MQRFKLLSEKANSVQGQKSNCRLLNKAFEDFHFKMSPGKLELGGINFFKSLKRPYLFFLPVQCHNEAGSNLVFSKWQKVA